MAEISRQEKLASAKKKLKQFQQRRTPRSGGADVIGTTPIRDQNGPLLSPPVVELGRKGQDSLQNILFSSPKRDGTEPAEENKQSTVQQESMVDAQNVKEVPHQDDTAIKNQYQNKSSIAGALNDHLSTSCEGKVSPVEKVKQISKQLNGLISQDSCVNGDDPIIKEIEALEGRNVELEQGLQSFKRSNQQLSKQLNDQRKQIILLQEQLKKERGDHTGKQQAEHSAMKEQLQVHIQTIGILVSEKSELQGNVASLQRKLQNKNSENEDMSNRLQAVRQRVAELERNVANLQMTCDKHHLTQKELTDDQEKVESKYLMAIKERDEFGQQASELREKLQMKVEECDLHESRVKELSTSLQKAQLVAHQLSPDNRSSDVIEELHNEKNVLESKLSTEEERYQKLSEEYQQIRERYRDHTEQLEKQVDALLKQVANAEQSQIKVTTENENLLTQISDLENELAEFKTRVTKEFDDSVVSERCSKEKEEIERELDIQIQENRRLGKEILEKEDQILELETSIKRAQEDMVDKVALLESIQSDKETISRAMQQNKDLKDQLEELQQGFVKMTNANAEVTNALQNEQHVTKELASKLSEVGVELEELKQQLTSKTKTIQTAEKHIDELKTSLDSTASSKDVELTTLRTEILRLNERLEEQLEANDRLAHMQARAELTDRLQIELQSAQDTINHMTSQNSSLRAALERKQNDIDVLEEEVERLEDQFLAAEQSNVEKKTMNSKHFTQSPTPSSLDHSVESELDQSVEGGQVEDEDSESEDDEESEVGEKKSIHYAEEDSELVQSLNMSIVSLQTERDELETKLEQQKELSNMELGRVREHMHLQLQQQMQLQHRQLNEHFHQQLHEQQLRLNSLQETIDTYKQQEALSEKDLNENNVSYETIKVAFKQLQNRFKKVMEDKASLIDRIQELEHKNVQLAIETETIGEYISLYQTQRQALKDKFTEKDRVISHLSNEHGRMQAKITQLQQLVSRILDERSGMEMEKRQLQELVNRRLALQTGSERSTDIPKLNYSLDSFLGENTINDNTDNYESESESALKSLSDATLEIKTFDEASQFETPRKESADGTAQQILQIFEQLGQTGEGYQPGWMSPSFRRKEFTPCSNCSHRLVHL